MCIPLKMPKNNTQSALRPNEPLSWYGYVKKFLFFFQNIVVMGQALKR